MTKKPNLKKKSASNPNVALKYSGMAFQMAAILAVGVFIGSKLDAYYNTEKPYLTALCVIIALPIAFYVSLKDLLIDKR